MIEQKKEIRKMLKLNKQEIDNLIKEKYPKIQQYIDSCFCKPDLTDLKLRIANAILEGHGIEATRGSRFISHYYQDTNLLYVNMGDAYVETVCFDTFKEKFIFTSWGDIVESKPKIYNL
jgi:hypothetical protein